MAQKSVTQTTAEIAALIVRRDRAFRPVITKIGPPPKRRAIAAPKRFETLVGSVISQLLSIKAADAIEARVKEACGGVISTDSILSLSHEELRGCGLSNAKVSTIHDIAQRVHDGRLRLDRHVRMDDDTVSKELCAVSGIGAWTAHMYLLFTLARPDVWPVGDLGVRRGWSILHRVDGDIAPNLLVSEGERFSGIRSFVAWYCWQAVHLHREGELSLGK